MMSNFQPIHQSGAQSAGQKAPPTNTPITPTAGSSRIQRQPRWLSDCRHDGIQNGASFSAPLFTSHREAPTWGDTTRSMPDGGLLIGVGGEFIVIPFKRKIQNPKHEIRNKSKFQKAKFQTRPRKYSTKLQRTRTLNFPFFLLLNLFLFEPEPQSRRRISCFGFRIFTLNWSCGRGPRSVYSRLVPLFRAKLGQVEKSRPLPRARATGGCGRRSRFNCRRGIGLDIFGLRAKPEWMGHKQKHRLARLGGAGAHEEGTVSYTHLRA